jgi:hypothetical protein
MAVLSKQQKDIKVVKQDNKNIAKVSNELLECFIRKNNAIGLKLLMFIAKSQEADKERIHSLVDDTQLVKIELDINAFLDYFKIDLRTLKLNIKTLTETSITIKTTKEEDYITLLPKASFKYSTNKGAFDVLMFPSILKLIFALERYSVIDVSTLSAIESKHSLRMLLLLERIANFSTNIAKRKQYCLEELNAIFGTNYKTFQEFDRRVLIPAKTELDSSSKLSFLYEIDRDKLDKTQRGRARYTHCTIDLLPNKNYQPKLF